MKKIASIIFGFIILLSTSVFAAEKITVFAAASLTNAMEDIKVDYLKQHPGQEIVFSFASSSVLARQIEQGAPVAIFMSADQQWMDYLIKHKLVKTKENLLKNSLVLIAPEDSKLNHVVINKETDWKKILPVGEKIAIGDPDHVPVGIYAKESLTHLGVYQEIEPQIARANSVRDGLMFVERGEAVLGIVYSTDAKISKKVKIIGDFPADSYTPVEYPIALLDDAGKSFYDYLKTPAAKAVFEKYGFGVE